MTVRRGELWLANLDPARGSEKSGFRPILILQNDTIGKYTSTVLAIPLTTNLRRASLPSCVRLAKGEGGLASESVALCHQLRVLDRSRLSRTLGKVSDETLTAVENRVLFTLGII